MKTLIAFSIGCLMMISSASADIVFDHDFTASQGFSDGQLSFQNGWLGQTGTTISDSAGVGVMNSGAWLRNVHGDGALGGSGGVAAGGAGFAAGDMIQITSQYQVDLGTLQNMNLAAFGLRDSGPNASNGFESAPQQGVRLQFNQFDPVTGGSIKFFGNGFTTGFGSNADALIIDGNDLGLDFANTGDSLSDNLEIFWKITADGAGMFSMNELTVTNLDTSATWTYSGGPQAFAWSATDAFMSVQLAPNGVSGHAGMSRAIKYEFIAANVPEPGSATLLGVLGLGLIRRRKR